MKELDRFLEFVCTDEIKRQLSHAVTKGFIEVEKLYNSQAFLATLTAKDPKPYMRRVAIDYSLLQLGKINPQFKCAIVPNAKKNCYHVEVKIKHPTGDLIITHNGINDPEEHPRKAIFREELEYYAQFSFKFENDNKVLSLPTREELERQASYVYGQLCYGGDELPEFLFIGISDSDSIDWLRKVVLPTRIDVGKERHEIRAENEPVLKILDKVESDEDEE